MIKIEGARGSGKTTKLIEIAEKDHLIIVEPTTQERDRVKHIVDESGKDVKVISMKEFMNFQNGRTHLQFLVDELDFFLAILGVVGYSQNITVPELDTIS